MPDVEIAKFKVGDKVRFTIEGEISHVMMGRTGEHDEGRICYMLNNDFGNGFVLLARDRDLGHVEHVRHGFWAMIADWLDYTFGGDING